MLKTVGAGISVKMFGIAMNIQKMNKLVTILLCPEKMS
jgi:hypothetical protein